MLCAGVHTGYYHTYELPSKTSTWYAVGDIEKLISDVKDKNSENVYIGVYPNANAKTSYQRSTIAEVCAQTVIVVDIDVKTIGAHAQEKLPDTTEEALEWLKTLELPPPSAVVHSGNGLQLYYALDKPFLIVDETSRKLAQKLSYGINRFIILEGNKKGWVFDNVGDLARIMRVPETLNHKSKPPKPVKLLELSGQRYGFDELMSFLPVETERTDSSVSIDDYDKNGKASDEKAQFESIRKGCRFIQHCVDGAAALPEPEWYRFLTIVARAENGEKICHKVSRLYADYNEAETAAKIDHALNASGPATCAYIAENLGFEGCMACPLYHAEKLKSPITLGFVPPALAKLLGQYAYCITTTQFCEVAA